MISLMQNFSENRLRTFEEFKSWRTQSAFMNDNSSSSEKKIVVLGGGTAGWPSAFLLQDFCRQHELSAKVTVIESSKIPVIGVGEGTTAIFKTFLDSFGLEEAEFLRRDRQVYY